MGVLKNLSEEAKRLRKRVAVGEIEQDEYEEIAARDINLFYEVFMYDYLERINNASRRDNIMRDGVAANAVIHPELCDDYRVHALRLTTYHLIQKAIDSGLVDLDIFTKCLSSSSFALSGGKYYWNYLQSKYDSMEDAWDEIKDINEIRDWYIDQALQYEDCPLEILMLHYVNVT